MRGSTAHSFRLGLALSSAVLIGMMLCANAAYGENIDPANDNSQFAYGENVGWMNAESEGDGGSGVEVSSAGLTGYLYGENIGWVSLSCQNDATCGTVNYGVTNDGAGNLAGYGYGENVGWISFSCTNTSTCGTVNYGVTIDPFTGEFGGYAYGENVGWISFSCANTATCGTVNYGVNTAWRAEADLQVTIQPFTTFPVSVDTNETFEVSVVNNGPDGATGVTVEIPLPAGVALVSAPGSCGKLGGLVTCNLGALASSAPAVVLPIKINIASPPRFLTFTATVSGNEVDPDTNDNSDTIEVIPTADPSGTPNVDLVLTAGDSPDPISVDNTLTYTFTVTNNGPDVASNVDVTILEPAAALFTSLVAVPAGSCVSNVCDVGTILGQSGGLFMNPGDVGTVTLTVVPTDPGTFTARATASSPAPDPNGANNTGITETTTVNPLVFTVDSVLDEPDVTIDGICATASAVCTLRAAIQEANATPRLDAIHFNIAGPGPHTISPTSSMPPIQQPLIIDGATEPDFTGTPVVELSGASKPAGQAGLTISAGNSTVRGLVINGFKKPTGGNIFAGTGIGLASSGNRIENNYIGTNVAGTAAVPNEGSGIAQGQSLGPVGDNIIVGNLISGNGLDGITLAADGPVGTVVLGNRIGTNAAASDRIPNGSHGVNVSSPAIAGGHTIGGPNPGDRNIISGNGDRGVLILNLSSGNVVQGNYIGTTGGGDVALGNGQDGITLAAASGNTVLDNVISGNGSDGVSIGDDQADGNIVRDNMIGTNAAGDTPIPNGEVGVKIVLSADDNVIGPGNVIAGNTAAGVRIEGLETTGNRVEGNFIGTNASNAPNIPNGSGVLITDQAAENTIGGPTAAARNIISGNTNYGVRLQSGAAENTLQNNYIGTNVAGTAPLPNGIPLGSVGAGVSIDSGANANQIGSVGAGNVISGNNQVGIEILDAGSNNNAVEGNFIGTNAAGTGPVANVLDGVRINNGPQGNGLIGNVISGNAGDGVKITGPGTTNNFLHGNFIGTNAVGLAPLGNGGFGVQVLDAPGNTIGGTAVGTNNLISGNTFTGVEISGAASTANVVEGNRIGTDVGADDIIPNGIHGVSINSNASGNTVGPNLISGNTLVGVSLTSGASGNQVLGNLIGTDGAGGPLANGANGVGIDTGATNNTIGAAGAGANTIAFNAQHGVLLSGSAGTGNELTQNSIFSNGDLGINLGDDSVTPNNTAQDPTDADTGPNNLQNFPVLTSLTGTALTTSTTIQGFLPSTPGGTFTLEFFSNPSCDPAGFGEGQTLVHTVSKTITAGNSVSFTETIAGDLAGQFLTATATDAQGNTSEFSRCVRVFADADGDGLNEEEEAEQGTSDAVGSVDSDGDGILDPDDNCPADPNADQKDTDGDLIGDVCDRDDDNDGVLDLGADGVVGGGDDDAAPLIYNAPLTYVDINGDLQTGQQDFDQDGVVDVLDNCPNGFNPTQEDLDGDGIGDATPCETAGTVVLAPNNSSSDEAEPDADNDGTPDALDNCPISDPTVVAPNQPDSDGDGFGDGCDNFINDADNDRDGDGIAGDVDNCPTVANANQADFNGDGEGDACDPDADNDGFIATALGGNDGDPSTLGDNDCEDRPFGANGIEGDADDGANINPGQQEVVNNLLDDDCDDATRDNPTEIEFVFDGTIVGNATNPTVVTSGVAYDDWVPTVGGEVTLTVQEPSDLSGVTTTITVQNQQLVAGDPVADNPTRLAGAYSNDGASPTDDDPAMPGSPTQDYQCGTSVAAVGTCVGFMTAGTTVALRSADFGGLITVHVAVQGTDSNANSVTRTRDIRIPRDDDEDGLADVLERQALGHNDLSQLGPSDDAEPDLLGRAQGGSLGDELTAQEELRGFRWGAPLEDCSLIAGCDASVYVTPAFVPAVTLNTAADRPLVRTDPVREKDVFLRYTNFADQAAAADCTIRGVGGQCAFALGKAPLNAGIRVHAVSDRILSRAGGTDEVGIDVVELTNDLTGTYQGEDPHIRKSTLVPRSWRHATKGVSTGGIGGVGTGSTYANPTTFQQPLRHYYEDRPIDDGGSLTTGINNKCDPGSLVTPFVAANGVLDSRAVVEDFNDNGVADKTYKANDEPWAGVRITEAKLIADGDPADGDNDCVLDHDLYITSWKQNPQDLTVFDVDDDGNLENPPVASVADITEEITPPQSIKHTGTHEFFHAIGCDHTPDHRGMMADTSPNWRRDRNILGGIDPTRPDAEFDQVCRGQIQIHNQ